MENDVMEQAIVAYRLKPVENSYEVPALDLFQFAEILGDDGLSLVRRQARTNESLLERWTPSRCELADEYKDGLPVPDVSLWGKYLILSEEAFNAFESMLSKDGEFLPLQVGFMQMYIFVPLQFAEEDKSKTLKRYEDGFECGVETLVFEQGSIENKAVFKSKMYGPHGLFATSKFKTLFDKHGFFGIEFDRDLAGIF